MTPVVHFNVAPQPDIALDSQDLLRRIAPAHLLDELQPSAPQAAYTTSATLWLLLYQRLHGGASLNDAVSVFLFHFPRQDLPDCKRTRDGLSASNSAYSKARTRLRLDVVDWLADHVYLSLAAGHQPSWLGRHVEILDGTTFSLASSEALRQAFPPPCNQYGPSAWPSLRAVVAHDLASGLTCRPEYGPAYGDDNECESVLTRRLLSRLRPGSVILGDGNFGIFIVAYEARQASHDMLLRLSGPRFEALRREAKDLGGGRWEVAWRPSADEWRKYGGGLPEGAEVRGYLSEQKVSIKAKQESLYLFTTLEEGSNQQWAELYSRRWDVEPDIGASKVTLNLGSVSALTEEMVKKEVVLASVAYNLVVSVRRAAAAQAKVDPRRLSFSGALSLVKALQARLAAGGLSEQEVQKLYEKLLRAVGQRKLPNRPGRQCPRELLPRRRRYPERKRSPPQPHAAQIDPQSTNK